MSAAAPTPTTSKAARRLARAKTIVEHVVNTWIHVLRRRTYLSAMGKDENLRRAIDLTYTANVQNTVRDVLIIDLIRSIGALVLDEDVRRAAPE